VVPSITAAKEFRLSLEVEHDCYFARSRFSNKSAGINPFSGT
jgi:hypothetical protein